jgi:cysteine desulfurase
VRALVKWLSVQRFYFDHNATTPLAPEVLETLTSCLGQVYGNASSIHHFGQAAKQRLEAARRQLAALIHANPNEVVFTSGGTEADNMAVLGVARRGRRRGEARHHQRHRTPGGAGTLRPTRARGVAVTRLRVGSDGVVDPDDVRRALRPDTVLVSVMHANNELGTIQPMEEIARIARRAGVPFHVDGVQALGKIPVDVEARASISTA